MKNSWLKYLLVAFFSILIVVTIIDLADVDKYITNAVGLSSYDIPFWSFLEIYVGTATVIVAYIAIYKSNATLEKQIRIEQTPFVTISRGIYNGKMEVKNIGRGMARRVIVFPNEKDWEEEGRKSFHDGKEPHSFDLGAGEFASVSVNVNLLETKKGEDDSVNAYCYIFFSDQLEKRYRVRAHLAPVNSDWKIMAHNFDENVDAIERTR